MGIAAHVVVVTMTAALVACSTFSSPADSCGHTYCQSFDEPVGAPWSLETENSTHTIEGNHLDIEVPANSNGNGTRLYLRLPSGVSKMKCGVTVTVTKAPPSGSIYLMALAATANPAPNTFAGAALSPSGLSLVVGDNPPVGSSAITTQSPTALVLEVDGDGTMPALTNADASTSAARAWTFGKVDQFFFGLKPNGQSTGAWAATFDDAWCDVTQ